MNLEGNEENVTAQRRSGHIVLARVMKAAVVPCVQPSLENGAGQEERTNDWPNRGGQPEQWKVLKQRGTAYFTLLDGSNVTPNNFWMSRLTNLGARGENTKSLGNGLVFAAAIISICLLRICGAFQFFLCNYLCAFRTLQS